MFIYKAIHSWGDTLGHFIAIDWSNIVAHQHHLLRASIIRKGRCITVYEETANPDYNSHIDNTVKPNNPRLSSRELPMLMSG